MSINLESQFGIEIVISGNTESILRLSPIVSRPRERSRNNSRDRSLNGYGYDTYDNQRSEDNLDRYGSPYQELAEALPSIGENVLDRIRRGFGSIALSLLPFNPETDIQHLENKILELLQTIESEGLFSDASGAIDVSIVDRVDQTEVRFTISSDSLPENLNVELRI